MEAHGNLRMLLDTLLDQETLNSWNIYEEKSGAVIVRIRLSPPHTISHVGHTNVQNIGYKRKSPARDQERARSYNERRITRSQARENGHTDFENIEKLRSDIESQFNDTGLSGLISPLLPALNPGLTRLSSSRSAPMHRRWSKNPRLEDLRRLLWSLRAPHLGPVSLKLKMS